MSFSTLGLDDRILRAVQEAGYTEPTPIQAAAIPEILSGRDVIGIAQTGTGKTAAFTLPILSRMLQAKEGAAGRRGGVRTLILAPTRELVVQIEENLRAYARHAPLAVAMVYGGVGERPQIKALRAGTPVIVATPGRLIDLMAQGHADFGGLEHLVLDEADRMLDMGFLPPIRQIVRALPGRRQTLLFSATLSPEIERLTHEFQQRPKTVQIGRRSNPAETVTQLVYEVPKHLKSGLLLHLLGDPQLDMVLVFARMKHAADRLARTLQARGIPTATLHSNRSQGQRLQALKDFKSGAVRVLVATDIAARGIDVDGISHVVNYDFPPHAEDYVHRIGRTGRAQAVGDAISFVTAEDQAAVRALERFIGRGLVRKKPEGFDVTAPAPPASQERPRSPGRTASPRGGGRSDPRAGQPQTRQPRAAQPRAGQASEARSGGGRESAPSGRSGRAPGGFGRARGARRGGR